MENLNNTLIAYQISMNDDGKVNYSTLGEKRTFRIPIRFRKRNIQSGDIVFLKYKNEFYIVDKTIKTAYEENKDLLPIMIFEKNRKCIKGFILKKTFNRKNEYDYSLEDKQYSWYILNHKKVKNLEIEDIVLTQDEKKVLVTDIFYSEDQFLKPIRKKLYKPKYSIINTSSDDEKLKLKGQRLKTLRKELKISQKDLASELYVSPSKISKMENGNSDLDEGQIELLNKKFSVNKYWIDKGFGEMITKDKE